ncbi:hypothetical protein CDAR_445701 [Caerostris darwini]|uniref:Uncharacterized protein n=1 Tax=Caerostris darwini TaxID=1538125 RepID=A0AAV4RWP8_9ARAC|nr:hypothetical protein CDAR_445701 [Caerostris darwini]
MLWICPNKRHCICSIRISHTHACHWEAESSAGVRGRHRHPILLLYLPKSEPYHVHSENKGVAAGYSCGSLSLQLTGCLFLEIYTRIGKGGGLKWGRCVTLFSFLLFSSFAQFPP